jgi:hypothetical protein
MGAGLCTCREGMAPQLFAGLARTGSQPANAVSDDICGNPIEIAQLH